jgi:hypothetical protein
MEEAIESSVTEEVTSENTGLLDEATPETEEVSEDQQGTAIDHRDPAELKAQDEFAAQQEEDGEEFERPEWFPEEFWDSENSSADGTMNSIEKLTKSYQHYKKLVSQGKHKVPDEYDTSAFGNTPEDDPIRSHVLNWAKENGVNQAGLDSLVSAVVDMGIMNQEQVEQDNKRERELLGPNAQARIDSTDRWLSGLTKKGVLSEDDLAEARLMGGTARGIAIFEKIRGSYEGRVPIQAAPVEGQPTMADVQEMIADPQYQTNANFRAKVERLINQIVPN